MFPTSINPLNYAEPTKRRRAWFRWSLLGVGLIEAWFGVWPIRQYIFKNYPRWHTVATIHWHWNDIQPPDFVVYEDDPQAAKAMIGGGRGYFDMHDPSWPPMAPLAGWIPPWWESLEPRQGGWNASSAATLFLHERRTRAGEPTLVWVGLNKYRTSDGQTGLLWRTATIAVLDGGSVKLRTRPPKQVFHRPIPGTPPWNPLDLPTTFYAGQPDLVDMTHFTIRYRCGAGSGIIDGHVYDLYNVGLTVRDGPCAGFTYPDD